ncbi:MAG: hypothetical protein PVJ04_17465, partial [Gemmatimonadota bacterium]
MKVSVPVLILLTAAGLAGWGCTGPGSGGPPSPEDLTGDWDYYRMLGAEPNGGFEARRRFGFIHFEGAAVEGSWFNRRSGEVLETVRNVRLEGDSLILDFASGTGIRARVMADSIAGRLFQGGEPIQRVWFVRREDPPVYEPYFPLWPGPVSDSS